MHFCWLCYRGKGKSPKENPRVLPPSHPTARTNSVQHYEAEIGRFDGQTSGEGGATYIDPKMRKSTDFPAWLAKPETKKKLAGKPILMYCTGGVRCEMASVLLKKELGEEATSNGVFQLQGGIENYFKEYEDGGHWNGSNFVFDKREAFSIESGPAGVGGVVRKKDLKRFKQLEKSGAVSNGKCCLAELECPTTRDALPMCVITGRHMVLDDWCFCPNSKSPALYSFYRNYIETERNQARDEGRDQIALDPVLNKEIRVTDLSLANPEDAKKYIQKYNNVFEEKKTKEKEGEEGDDEGEGDENTENAGNGESTKSGGKTKVGPSRASKARSNRKTTFRAIPLQTFGARTESKLASELSLMNVIIKTLCS